MDTKSTRCRGRRETAGQTACVVERLEGRRLLSADLAPAFVGNVPGTLPPAVKKEVTVRVANRGNATAAGAVTVRLFASADAALDAADMPLGQTTKSLKLKAGGGKALKVRITPPAGLASGNYSLLAQVETAAAGSNADPANDVAASPAPVAVQEPFVDLTGTFAAQPYRPIALTGRGREAKVRVKVVNNGNAPASGPLAVSLYLSSDATLDAADAPIVTKAVGQVNLKARRSKVVTLRFTLPPGTTAGTFRLLAVVNSAAVNGTGGIPESDTTNNVVVARRSVVVVNGYRRFHRGRDFVGGGFFYGDYFVDNGYWVDEGYDPYDYGTPVEPGPSTLPADGGPDGDVGGSDFYDGGSSGADFGGDPGGGFSDDPGADSGGGDSGGDDGGDFGGDYDSGGDSGGTDFGGSDSGSESSDSGGSDFSSDSSSDSGGGDDWW